jgi:hypothetical protein
MRSPICSTGRHDLSARGACIEIQLNTSNHSREPDQARYESTKSVPPLARCARSGIPPPQDKPVGLYKNARCCTPLRPPLGQVCIPTTKDPGQVRRLQMVQLAPKRAYAHTLTTSTIIPSSCSSVRTFPVTLPVIVQPIVRIDIKGMRYPGGLAGVIQTQH